MKKFLCFLLAVILALSLVGCKEKETETPVIEEDDTQTGVINLQMRQPDTLDPILTTRKSVRDILLMIYEPLFNITDSFGCEKVLAENYAFNGNASVFTVRIKEGVLWHNKVPLTSDDVIYTVNKIMNSPDSSYYVNLKNVERVEKLSSYEVAFYLKRSDSGFMNTLYFPIEYRDFDESKVVGTGAYMFSESDGKSMKLVKNEQWHGGEAKCNEVNVIYMRTAMMAQEAFASGKIHAVTMDMIDTENFPIKDSNTRYFYPDGLFEFIGFNTNEGIFTQSLLRIAVSNALNRKEIKGIFGSGKEAGFPVMVGSDLYSPGYEAAEFNLDYAKEVIFSAGWRDTDYDNIPDKVIDGEKVRLEFSLLCADSLSSRVEAAECVKKQLGEAGFVVKVEVVSAEEFDERLESGHYDAFIGAVYCDKPYDMYELLHSKGGVLKNGYKSEEMDEALDEFSIALDEDDSARAFVKIQSVYTAQQPVAGLLFRESYVVTNRYITGEVKPFPYSPYANVHLWIVK